LDNERQRMGHFFCFSAAVWAGIVASNLWPLVILEHVCVSLHRRSVSTATQSSRSSDWLQSISPEETDKDVTREKEL